MSVTTTTTDDTVSLAEKIRRIPSRNLGFTLQAALLPARREVTILRSETDLDTEEIKQETLAMNTLLRRWVRVSIVWDSRLLTRPHLAQYLGWQLRAGIEVRTASRVPATLALVDDQTSLVSAVSEDGGTGRGVTLSTCPETTGMLRYLFLRTWADATPLSASGPWTGDGQTRLVMRMLAEGATDDQIAHEMSVSKRTVSRTVARVMTELNARSRFEAGVIAARLGYFETSEQRWLA
ncbi:helix-turn-helix transcriptional regulator [Streptomyces sp. TP-A0874]|uniref:helix-turn-helix transcriptional regulator n=1 Tax=Streptomyces sp. TP-A0874 TaxID=549819 RepID=UPI0008532AC8|nr:helix-turn-helix transcriptional regulator [Streptomyces sp. TP-A0874]